MENAQQQNQQEYRTFYESHPEICVFSAPWWLDAVAGQENWDVVFARDAENKIIASFPFAISKGRFGLKHIAMPPLTQKLGPFVVYPDGITSAEKVDFEHDVFETLIKQLPKFDTFNINFGQEYKDWLPFYWNGFSQTVRYSYRIADIKNSCTSDGGGVFKGFAKYKRQKIQKANNLTLKFDLDLDAFYDYFEQVVNDRGEQVSYSRDFFKKLYTATYEHNQGRILYCVDENDNIHAIGYVVWDKNVAYYLVAMRKKEYHNSGGTEFLVWEIIKYVSQFVDIFDFEGSMIKGVEESFRFYGAEQTEYFNISKCNNKLLKIYTGLRGLL